MNLKIGLITFHRANNFGAVLQAHALQKYICDNICECEIIDFIPNNQVDNASGIVRRTFRLCKRLLIRGKSFFVKDRSAKFADFRKNFLLSKRTYYGDKELIENPPHYDIVISGSDQILNMTLSGNSYSYYLKPWTNLKKISYASSFGRSELTEIECETIKNELPLFGGISVREKSSGDIILNHTGRNVPMVADPCFLLSKEYWNKVADAVNITSRKYILVYAMEYSESIKKIILHELQNHRNVYLLCGGKSAEKLPGVRLNNIGPFEFLAYIKKSHMLITNSFHGTAFGMIFDKEIICVAHSTRNDRIVNILAVTDNSKRLIDCTKCDEDYSKYKINGRDAYDKMLDLINFSKEYLENSLEL